MKKALALALCLVMVLALAACGPQGGTGDPTPPATNPGTQDPAPGPGSDEPVELMFWTMWDGGDVAIANAMFEEYNNTHDNVNITFQQQDFNQYATKLKTGVLGNDGPDFAIAYVGGFVTGLQADGVLVPISAEAERLGVDINFGGFTQTAMDASEVDGDYYAIPCDNLIRVLMYNKALLKDSGLLNADGSLKITAGEAGFNELMTTAQSSLPAGVETLALTMRPPQLVLGWLTMYAQMGGTDFVDADNRVCTFDDAIALRALETYRDIYVNYVPEGLTPPADLDMFKAGRAAFYIDGAWNVSAAADALGDDFGVTTFPQIGERNALITTNHAFIIPKKDNMTDAKTTAILEFIQWWGENNWKWSEAGHLPAYNPSAETAEFNAMPWPKYYKDTLEVAIPIYTIPNANLHQISETTDPIQKAMLGQMSCEDAIRAVKDNLNMLLPNL